VSRKTNRRAKKAEGNRGKPGFIFLEIDGLSEAVLRKALENGTMPTLASWIKNGSHRIKGWETDFSSQTAASQAGILHGNNRNIPAFRWVEKAKGNKVVSTASLGYSEIESRISDGHGLPRNGRAASFAPVTPDNVFVYSKFSQMMELYRQSSTFSAASFNFVTPRYICSGDGGSRSRYGNENLERLEHPGLVYITGPSLPRSY
jgi:hypothetical protein